MTNFASSLTAKPSDTSQPRNITALSAQIADDLQRRILSGEFMPGDRMPSERQLGTAYAVSRTAVREAIKRLCERGLLCSHPGRGTFIAEAHSITFASSMALAMIRSKVSLSDVLCVRRLIEMETASLAAAHRTNSDLLELDEALEAMDRSLDAMDEYVAGDHRFHRAMAVASGNPLLVLLTDALADALQSSRRVLYFVEGAPVRGQRQHRAIVDAVREHDVAAAGAAMSVHLEEIAHATAMASASGRNDERIARSDEA